MEFSPAVRGIHFQPVAYLGRFPTQKNFLKRFTLDDLIAALCEQTGIHEDAFIPSRCDHALCGFHATFLRNDSGGFVPLTNKANDTQDTQRTSAERKRNFTGSHWSRKNDQPAISQTSRENFFSLSNKLDAMNLNLERLYRCSLHVYDDGRLLPFCAKYLTSFNTSC